MIDMTVSFVPGGEKIVCVPLTLLNDTLLEMEEYFRLRIDSVSPAPRVIIGNNGLTTLFITDDDSRLNH